MLPRRAGEPRIRRQGDAQMAHGVAADGQVLGFERLHQICVVEADKVTVAPDSFRGPIFHVQKSAPFLVAMAYKQTLAPE